MSSPSLTQHVPKNFVSDGGNSLPSFGQIPLYATSFKPQGRSEQPQGAATRPEVARLLRMLDAYNFPSPPDISIHSPPPLTESTSHYVDLCPSSAPYGYPPWQASSHSYSPANITTSLTQITAQIPKFTYVYGTSSGTPAPSESQCVTLVAPVLSDDCHRCSDLSNVTPGPSHSSSREFLPLQSDVDHAHVVDASRYKTTMCRNFQKSGVCSYGSVCVYAHGPHELRDVKENSTAVRSLNNLANQVVKKLGPVPLSSLGPLRQHRRKSKDKSQPELTKPVVVYPSFPPVSGLAPAQPTSPLHSQ